MMSNRVASLLETLEQERACCQRLIDVSHFEQESLVNNDLDGVNARVMDMQRAVRRLHELHSNRHELLGGLARHFSMDPEELSLQLLADRLDTGEAGELREKARALARTAEALYKVNQNTIYLINFSLDLVDRQIEAWTDALSKKDGYDQEGQSTRQASDATIIERKA